MKTVAYILIAALLFQSVPVQATERDFAVEALSLPFGVFHQPNLVKGIATVLRSKIGKAGIILSFPSLAKAHEFFLDKGGNLMVRFDAWSAKAPAENTPGGLGRDIVKAAGEKVTWPRISAAVEHLQTKFPVAGKSYKVTGLSEEVTQKLVKAVTKATAPGPIKAIIKDAVKPAVKPAGRLLTQDEIWHHWWEQVAPKAAMRITGFFHGGLFVELNEAHNDPFKPTFRYFIPGTADIHVPMRRYDTWEYLFPHGIPFMSLGVAAAVLGLVTWAFVRYRKTAVVTMASLPLLAVGGLFAEDCPPYSTCYNPYAHDFPKPWMRLESLGNIREGPWVSLHEPFTYPGKAAFSYSLSTPEMPHPWLTEVDGFWKLPLAIYQKWMEVPLGMQIILIGAALVATYAIIKALTPKARLKRMLYDGQYLDPGLTPQNEFIEKYGSYSLVRFIHSLGDGSLLLRYVYPKIKDQIKSKEDAENPAIWRKGMQQVYEGLNPPHWGQLFQEPEGYFGMPESGYSQETESVFIETKPGYWYDAWLDPNKKLRAALENSLRIPKYLRVSGMAA